MYTRSCNKGLVEMSDAVADLFKIGKLNHVAIATPDLEKTLGLYKGLMNAKVSEAVEQPEHGVITVFVELGGANLELLKPMGEHSPIQHFLDKNKSGGLHHLCIEVDNLEDLLRKLRGAGIRTLGDKPKIGAHGCPVMFLHPKDTNGVLIELEEVPADGHSH